jgi:hypothetical protein
MVVALTALVVALSGTALAATSMGNGDQLIKPNSLSGDRLRNHTVTGRQIDLSRLGQVPSAVHAVHAAQAVNAARANNAANAAKLAGLLPSSVVQGGGRVFHAHAILTGAKQIVTIPEIGALDGFYFFDRTLGENVVVLDLTGGKNETGHAVDEVTLDGSDGDTDLVRAAQFPAGASWNDFQFGNPGVHIGLSTPRVFVVQFGWGSGASAHVVTLTCSLFSVTGGGDLALQGTAS